MDTATLSTNGTSDHSPTEVRRGPGRPRKDGSAPQPSTTKKATKKARATIEKDGIGKFLNNETVREFLLLPSNVQESIRQIVAFENGTGLDFDLA
jgi:hypothetical protein